MMEWKRGEFHRFRATAKIHIGAAQTDIYEDDEIEFDGQTLRYAGAEYSVPSLRGALKAGWLVDPEDNVSRYVSQPAGVKVRPATAAGNERGEPMEVGTATSEEQVVGTLDGHQARREESKKETREARRPAHRPTRKGAAPPPVPAKGDPMDLSPDELAAVQRANEINRRRLEAAKNQDAPPPADSEPESPTGAYTVVGDDQEAVPVGGIQFTSGAQVGATGDKHLTDTVDVTKTSAAQERAKVRPVGQRKTQVPAKGNEDIATTHVTGATGDVPEARSGEHLTELLSEAAVGPLPDPKVSWDKSPHWRTRVKIAVEEFGDNPDALAEIYSVESPGVIKNIKAKLDQR